MEPAASNATLLNISDIEIPPEIGTPEDFFYGKSSKVFLLIADAHSIPDAQQNIQRLIHFFQKKYSFNVVGFEGAASNLDAQILQSFPDKNVLREVLKRYMRKGELSGVNAAAILNKQSNTYYGLEKWGLYEKGLELYSQARKNSEHTLEKINRIKKKLRKEKQKIYSETLYQLDKSLELFDEDKIDLKTILETLSKIKAPSNTHNTLQTIIEEFNQQKNSHDLFEGEIEVLSNKTKNFLLEKLKANHDKAIKKDFLLFNQKYQGFRTSQVVSGELLSFLKRLSAKYQLPLHFSEVFNNQIDHETRLRNISGSKLSSQLESYSQSVKADFFRNNEEQRLDEKSRKVRRLEKLTRLEIDREDWEKLKNENWEDETFQAYVDFYQNAEIRESYFIDNVEKRIKENEAVTSSQERAVIVAGGFHIDGLKEILRRKNFSYVVVHPAISSFPKENYYHLQMQGKVSWNNHFEIESGRVNLYKGFIRGIRESLLQEATKTMANSTAVKTDLLKFWRDQIIKDLAKKKKISSFPQYANFIDEAFKNENNKKFQRVENFIKGLDLLKRSETLTAEDILNILPSSSIVAAAIAAGLDPIASLRAEDVFLKRSEVRVSRHTMVVVRDASGETPETDDRVNSVLKPIRENTDIGIVTVIGGAMKKDGEALNELFSRALSQISRQREIAVITGGLGVGIASIVAEARKVSKPFPLIGIAPESNTSKSGRESEVGGNEEGQFSIHPEYTHLITTGLRATPAQLALDSHHDFKLAPQPMFKILTKLSEGHPKVTVVASGGDVTYLELKENIQRGWGVIVLKGSGRLADNISAILEGHTPQYFADTTYSKKELAGLVKNNQGLFTVVDYRNAEDLAVAIDRQLNLVDESIVLSQAKKAAIELMRDMAQLDENVENEINNTRTLAGIINLLNFKISQLETENLQSDHPKYFSKSISPTVFSFPNSIDTLKKNWKTSYNGLNLQIVVDENGFCHFVSISQSSRNQQNYNDQRRLEDDYTSIADPLLFSIDERGRLLLVAIEKGNELSLPSGVVDAFETMPNELYEFFYEESSELLYFMLPLIKNPIKRRIYQGEVVGHPQSSLFNRVQTIAEARFIPHSLLKYGKLQEAKRIRLIAFDVNSRSDRVAEFVVEHRDFVKELIGWVKSKEASYFKNYFAHRVVSPEIRRLSIHIIRQLAPRELFELGVALSRIKHMAFYDPALLLGLLAEGFPDEELNKAVASVFVNYLSKKQINISNSNAISLKILADPDNNFNSDLLKAAVNEFLADLEFGIGEALVISSQIAERLHEDWRKTRGSAPRWKVTGDADLDARVQRKFQMQFRGQGIKGRTLDYFHVTAEGEIDEAGNPYRPGTVLININADFSQLNSVWKVENESAARDGWEALAFIKDKGFELSFINETLQHVRALIESGEADKILSHEDKIVSAIVDALDLIHSSWINRKRSQKKSMSPGLEKPYREITAVDQMRDLNILQTAIDLSLGKFGLEEFQAMAVSAMGQTRELRDVSPESIASALHERWKISLGLDHDFSAERWKPAGDRKFSQRKMAELGLSPGRTIGAFRVTEEGALEIDIAHLDFDELSGPWQRENLVVGKEAVSALDEAIKRGIDLNDLRNALRQAFFQLNQGQKISSETFVQGKARQYVLEVGRKFHGSWKTRNPSIQSISPEKEEETRRVILRKSFDDLAPLEQRKNLDILQVALEENASLVNLDEFTGSPGPTSSSARSEIRKQNSTTAAADKILQEILTYGNVSRKVAKRVLLANIYDLILNLNRRLRDMKSNLSQLDEEILYVQKANFRMNQLLEFISHLSLDEPVDFGIQVPLFSNKYQSQRFAEINGEVAGYLVSLINPFVLGDRSSLLQKSLKQNGFSQGRIRVQRALNGRFNLNKLVFPFLMVEFLSQKAQKGTLPIYSQDFREVSYSTELVGLTLQYLIGILASKNLSFEDAALLQKLSSLEMKNAKGAISDSGKGKLNLLRLKAEKIKEKVLTQLAAKFGKDIEGLVGFESGALSVNMTQIQKFIQRAKVDQVVQAAA